MQEAPMRRSGLTAAALLVGRAVTLGGWVSTAMAQGPTELAQATELVALCRTPETSADYAANMGFCQGYMVGAYHYQLEMARGPGGKMLICVPNPRPTMPEAVAAFVAWADANPQYGTATPIEAFLRWAMAAYPCKKA
jgi:hypothetical protein